jgi:hypothetical protein
MSNYMSPMQMQWQQQQQQAAAAQQQAAAAAAVEKAKEDGEFNSPCSPLSLCVRAGADKTRRKLDDPSCVVFVFVCDRGEEYARKLMGGSGSAAALSSSSSSSSTSSATTSTPMDTSAPAAKSDTTGTLTRTRTTQTLVHLLLIFHYRRPPLLA